MRTKTHPQLAPRRRVLRSLAALAAPHIVGLPQAHAGGPPEAAFTPWAEAIERRQVQALAALLVRQGRPDLRDGFQRTPLHLAALADFVAGVQLLLTAGAEVDARNRAGATPLHHAGPQAQPLLLAAGADGAALNGIGRVPLHTVAVATPPLLKPGIDVRDRVGMTPLHVAAWNGDADKVDWLLRHGADPQARSTAVFDLQQQPGWTEIDPRDRFEPGQRPLDLVRWQHERVKWATSRYSRALQKLDDATPRAGWFRR